MDLVHELEVRCAAEHAEAPRLRARWDRFANAPFKGTMFDGALREVTLREVRVRQNLEATFDGVVTIRDGGFIEVGDLAVERGLAPGLLRKPFPAIERGHVAPTLRQNAAR